MSGDINLELMSQSTPLSPLKMVSNEDIQPTGFMIGGIKSEGSF